MILSLFSALTSIFSVSDCAPVYANDNLWTIGFVGGNGASDTSVSFWNDMSHKYKTFKPFTKKEKSAYYFGDLQKGRCYTQPTEESQKLTDQAYVDFENNPKSCKGAEEILGSMLELHPSETICDDKNNAKLADLDGDSKPDIDGYSHLSNLKSSLNNVINKAKKGDHLLLSFSDHGIKSINPKTGAEWNIYLGHSESKFTPKYLQPFLESLTQNGITVHLDIFACYSGGFLPLTDVSSKSASVCMTTLTDSDHIGFGTLEENYYKGLGKGNSFLESYACAMTQDAHNRPTTSLDHIITTWENKNKIKVNATHCPMFVTDLTGMDKEVEVFINLLGEKSRKELTKLYADYFLKPAQKCRQPRDQILKLNKAMGACFRKILGQYKSQSKDKIDSEHVEEIVEAIVSAESVKGEPYNIATINRHLNFLKNADSKSLEKFKQSFCCLTYNPKTGATPDLCKN